MLRSFFQEQDDTPLAVQRFERLWLFAIYASMVVAIEMYSYTVEIVGKYPALLANLAYFVAALLLMMFASRRRSNLARFLMIPFLGLILFYDLAHVDVMMSRGSTMMYTLGRLGLAVAAIYSLFTPSSRAWFAGRDFPTSEEE